MLPRSVQTIAGRGLGIGARGGQALRGQVAKPGRSRVARRRSNDAEEATRFQS